MIIRETFFIFEKTGSRMVAMDYLNYFNIFMNKTDMKMLECDVFIEIN